MGHKVLRLFAGLLSSTLVATGLALVVGPATPAFAASIISDFTTYGPNAVITITGGTDLVTTCPSGGTNDVFGISTARVYIIAEKTAEGITDGSKLTDVQPFPHVVVDSPTAGFFSEPIGFTQPAGHVGPGAYAVVVNECQDGIFHAGIDTIFNNAFAVAFPNGTGSLPPVDPAIAKIKADAGLQAARWLATLGGLKLIFAINDALPQDAIDTLLSKIQDELSNATGVDPQADIQTLVANEAQSYGSIFADPPDPNFTSVAPIQMAPPLLATVNDPLSLAATALGNQANVDNGTAQAVLNALQRYKGAQQAGDLQSGLNQALALQGYASDLAAQLAKTNAALSALENQIGALPASFDTRSARLALAQQEVKANGLNTDQTAALSALGISQAAVTQAITDFESQPAGASRAQLQALIGALITGNNQAAADYQALATDATNGLPPLIDNLQTQENNADAAAAAAEQNESSPSPTPIPVALPGPTARPGGPYTGTVGTPVALDGSASTAANGAAITTFAWDDDGTGHFTGATGAKPSVTLGRPFDGFVGLQVTDSNGLPSLAYTRLTVTSGAVPPAISAFSPTTNPRVGRNGSQPFSVTATPANATYQWSVDGAPAAGATGPSFTFQAPATTSFHLVKVVVSAPDPAGGSDTRVWKVEVLDPPGALDHLDLAPSASNGTVGAPQGYLVEGWAKSPGGDLGDVTGVTSFTIGPDGSCAGPSCTPASAGVHTVTGTDGAARGTATLTVPAIGTTTALFPSPASPAVFGQPVQFTATVTRASGVSTPTGSVDFRDGATLLGSVPLSDGGATLTTSALAVAGHSVSAAYGGSTTFAGSEATLPYTVNPAATSLALAPAHDTITLGSADSVTVTASPVAPGGATPAGNVTVSVDDNALPSVALSGGGAVITIPATSLPVGPHTLGASYAGNVNFLGATAKPVTVTVNSGPAVTTQPGDQTVVTGQAATFTAAASGNPPPAVQWQVSTNGGPFTDIASATSAQLTVASPIVSLSGSQYRAVFANSIGTATTHAATLTVNKGATTTALAIAPAPGTVRTPFAVTATVTPTAPAAGTPGGSVIVADGAGQTCAITLANGTGTCNLIETSTGAFRITGSYGGDVNFTASAAPAVTENVGSPSNGVPGGGIGINGFATQAFATDFPASGVGPIGLAFDASGRLYVGDYIDGNVYRFGPSGGAAAANKLSTAGPVAGTLAGLTFSKTGRLYAIIQNQARVVELDPNTGAVLRTVESGHGTCDLKTDPLSGDLFVTDCGSALVRISHVEDAGPVMTSVYGPGGDGFVFGPDGTIFESGAGVLEIAGTDKAQPAAVTRITNGGPGPIDGIALINPPAGQRFTKLAVNRNDGVITQVDFSNPAAPVLTDIVTGGTRGDFVTTGPDGCLYATQAGVVERVTSADGSCPFVPRCPPSSLVLAPPSQTVPFGPATLSATLTDGCGQPEGDTSVTFSVTAGPNAAPGPKATVATNSSGGATFTYSGATPGTDTVQASATDPAGPVTSNHASVTWGPPATTLAYTGPTTGDHGDTVTLAGTLATVPTGPAAPNVFTAGGAAQGVAGKTLTLTLGSHSCTTGPTDSNGVGTCNVTVSDETGTLSAGGSFLGDAAFGASSAPQVNFAVTTEETVATFTGAATGDFNDAVALTGTLTDGETPAVPIAGKTLVLSAGTQSCSATTDSAGKASCPITLTQAAGGVTAGAAFTPDPGDGDKAAASPAVAFTITKEEDTLTYTGATNITDGTPTRLAAALDEDGAVAVPGRTVAFTLGSGHSAQTCSGATDEKGSASCTLTANQPTGPGSVAAAFSGDGFYLPASVSQATAVVNPTSLTIGPATTGDFNDPVTLSGTLLDSSGKAVANAKVGFVLDNAESCQATTDPSGKASCSVTPQEAAGSYPLTATFAGDVTYSGSRATAMFGVSTEETALAYTGPTLIGQGSPVTVSAVVGTDKVPLANRSVLFTVGAGASAQTCRAATDATGAARCAIPAIAQPLGATSPCGAGARDLSGSTGCTVLAVIAGFAGDGFFAPASDTPAAALATISCTATVTGNVSGTVMVAKGTTCINGATVGGAVLVSRGAALVVLNANLHGAVVSTGASAVTVCNSTVGGALTVRGTIGLVLVGAGTDASLPCAANNLAGGVVIGGSGSDSNTGGIELAGNTIGGGVNASVTVNGNVAPNGGAPTENNATEIEGNTVAGSITCNGNTPAPANDGEPNKASGASSGQCAGI